MKILFLVHRYPKNSTILEKDLIKIFSRKGHDILVVVPNDKINKEETYVYQEDKVKVLYVKTGNYANNVSRINKVITILSRNFLLKKAIIKYFREEKVDYIFGYTPFMANDSLIKFLKKLYNSKAGLFLWDIFPQNAKDLGIIKNKFVFNFFKNKEKRMYKEFDKIICNCDGQIEYILNNKLKEKDKLFIVRNSEFITEEIEKKDVDKKYLKEKYGFSENDIIGIFGGNMGIPQKLDNLIFMAEKLKKNKELKFIFIGQGTEKNKILNLVNRLELPNIKIYNFLERKKYEEILSMADIAMISLNEKYTVPNFPAKITGYCKIGKPIFANLDSCSYKFLGKFILENNIGKIVQAGNINNMAEEYLNLINELKKFDSNKIKEVYKQNFDVEKAYKTIMNEINKK